APGGRGRSEWILPGSAGRTRGCAARRCRSGRGCLAWQSRKLLSCGHLYPYVRVVVPGGGRARPAPGAAWSAAACQAGPGTGAVLSWISGGAERADAMRVFLTGGTGLVGSHVARRLRERGHDVVALVRPGREAPELGRL